MSGKPTHTLFVVQDAPEGSDKKAIWRDAGAAWPLKNGRGFSVVIHDQLAVSGRLVLIERKEEEQASPGTSW